MRARVPTPRAQELTNLPLDQTMDYPRPYKLRNFYTEKEVAQHNCHDDCWVSLFNKVYDLTKLLQENYTKPECDPITLAAGTDITHWFDLETFCVSNLLKVLFLQPKTFIDAKSGLKQYYAPTGRYLHLPPVGPDSDWNQADFTVPWWQDNRFIIGSLTSKTRQLRVINTLTKHDTVIECADEESINEILDRYLITNQHAASYTWKRLGKPLNMAKTLDENGIVDDTREL